MALFFQYDPSRVTVTWRFIAFQGFGPDTFVKCTWNADLFTEIVGVAGWVVRLPNNDTTGRVSITLLSRSPSNDAMTAAAATGDVGHLVVKDLNGATLIDGTDAQILKLPDHEYAADSNTTEWVLACSELQLLLRPSP